MNLRRDLRQRYHDRRAGLMSDDVDVRGFFDIVVGDVLFRAAVGVHESSPYNEQAGTMSVGDVLAFAHVGPFRSFAPPENFASPICEGVRNIRGSAIVPWPWPALLGRGCVVVDRKQSRDAFAECLRSGRRFDSPAGSVIVAFLSCRFDHFLDAVTVISD